MGVNMKCKIIKDSKLFSLICLSMIISLTVILTDVTLENGGNDRYRIYVRMLKCCEVIRNQQKDCDFMNLLGGDMGVLNAKCIKNITLLYPNMYLHNRLGECKISLIYLNEQEQAFETKKVIKFNTTVSKTGVPTVMRDYYNTKELKICATIDLDPLDSCQPVNCPMKYLGNRNYFNRKRNLCQKVPLCVADPHKEMPDVAYVPISNKCRDLEKSLGKKDLFKLEKGTCNNSWHKANITIFSSNLRCHHGTIDNETGFCCCKGGWTSVPFDKSQYEPSLSLYHMCNIRTGSWNALNSDKIKMTALLLALAGVLTAMAILLLAFLMYVLYKCIKNFETCNRSTCSRYCRRSCHCLSFTSCEENPSTAEREQKEKVIALFKSKEHTHFDSGRKKSSDTSYRQMERSSINKTSEINDTRLVTDYSHNKDPDDLTDYNTTETSRSPVTENRTSSSNLNSPLKSENSSQIENKN